MFRYSRSHRSHSGEEGRPEGSADGAGSQPCREGSQPNGSCSQWAPSQASEPLQCVAERRQRAFEQYLLESEYDFYKILGVDGRATQSQIQGAYKRLLRRAHPDKGGCAQDFIRIQLAYSVLSTPFLRSVYDESGYQVALLYRDLQLNGSQDTAQQHDELNA